MRDGAPRSANTTRGAGRWSGGLAAGFVAFVVILGAITAGTVFGGARDLPFRPFVAVMGAAAGGALAVLAVKRFWLMLVVLFAVRTSLDAFKVDAFGSGGLEPGTVVGAVFLVAAIAWLAGEWQAGRWVRISRSSKALLVFAGAAMLSSVGADLRFQSFQQSSKLLSVAVMLVVLEQLFRRHPDRIRPILAAILASLVVPTVIGYSQVPGSSPGDGYNAAGVGRVKATFVHPNSFAVYLQIVILLSVAMLPYVTGWWRRSMLVAILTASPLVLFTYARGAWIALVVALLFIGLTQSRTLVYGLLTLVVVVALTVPSVWTRLSDLDRPHHAPRTSQLAVQPDSLSWRIGYWGRVLPLGFKSPVTGIGFEMVREKRVERLPPHNAFVQAFVETGVLGFAALLAVIAAMWADLRRAARRLQTGFGRGMSVAAAAICLSVLIQLLSENLLSQPALLWYLIAPVAWVLAVGRASEPVADPALSAPATIPVPT